MGWKAAYAVRMSGLKGKTKTDVLEALAAMLNEKTGDCFPSTETIAKVARVSPNFVRPTLKELEEEGLIATLQKPGCVRHFRLFLDRLPEPLLKPEGVAESEPLTKPLPLTKSEGVTKPLGDPSRNHEGTPNETVRGPLTKPLPEQGKELGIELGKELVSRFDSSNDFKNPPPPVPTDSDLEAMSAEAEQADLFSGAVEMVDLPKEKAPAKKPRAKKPSIARPDDVSEQTWNDFQTLRKTRRAPITQTVIDGFRKECAIAGIDLEEAMKICVRQGWQGFKADWCRRDNRSDYLPNSKFKRQECRKYKKGI